MYTHDILQHKSIRKKQEHLYVNKAGASQLTLLRWSLSSPPWPSTRFPLCGHRCLSTSQRIKKKRRACCNRPPWSITWSQPGQHDVSMLLALILLFHHHTPLLHPLYFFLFLEQAVAFVPSLGQVPPFSDIALVLVKLYIYMFGGIHNHG